MKKTDISKKRSFIVTAVKESEMIHVILTVLAIVVGIVIDYFLAEIAGERDVYPESS